MAFLKDESLKPQANMTMKIGEKIGKRVCIRGSTQRMAWVSVGEALVLSLPHIYFLKDSV